MHDSPSVVKLTPLLQAVQEESRPQALHLGPACEAAVPEPVAKLDLVPLPQLSPSANSILGADRKRPRLELEVPGLVKFPTVRVLQMLGTDCSGQCAGLEDLPFQFHRSSLTILIVLVHLYSSPMLVLISAQYGCDNLKGLGMENFSASRTAWPRTQKCYCGPRLSDRSKQQPWKTRNSCAARRQPLLCLI